MEESVFAIPTSELWKLLAYNENGLIRGNSHDLNRIVQHGQFRKRSELEEDPSFKQIIPYGIISHEEFYYLFTRKPGQREKRLQYKLHLGVGGHVNPGSAMVPGDQYLVNELKREFIEEVKPFNGCMIEDIEFIGFINDESIPVSRVHIGLLYDIHVSNKNLAVNEPEKMKAEWIAKADLADYYEKMETWTRIAFDQYIRKGESTG